MKIKLLGVMAVAILFLMPNVNYAQAPVLGTAASFVLFTTNGAMTCSGTKYLTHLTGNVGSNLAGSVTGFGNVDGVMHADDATTAACTADVSSLYTDLSTRIPTGPLASPFGGGDTLVAGVYEAAGAATLTGNLILNGQGNPNALFIFQVGGVLTTNALSKVILINGALACNVFWQVNGAIGVGTGTTLRGTIVANGEIDMTSTLDTLEGRALAKNAAVLVSQLVAYTPIGCGSTLLTGPAAPPMLDSTAAYGVFGSSGAVTSTPITYVIGSVGENSPAAPTGFNPLDVTGAINAMDASTASAAADLLNIYDYLVALPADIDLLDPSDFGHGLVLTPHSYQVTGVTSFTGNIILNAEGDANAVFVIKVNGSFTSTVSSKVILMNGAQAKNVYWKIDGAVDILSNSVFNGTMVVAGAISLETGDTLNGRALSISGAIAINQSYIDITPISTGCVAPAIGGIMNVCPGATTMLTDSSAGGTWTSSNSAVAIIGSSSGIATGVLPGTSTITYTTPALCTNTTTVTVNAAPLPITGPGSVCVGSTITLADITTGGTWSSSNTSQATVGSGSGIVGGVAPGAPIITYSVPGSCNATKTVIVGSNAGGITGPSSVCIGSTIMMADSTGGGSWTGSNGNATVIGNTVTGNFAGADTIMYTVTDACGTMTATKIITVDSASTVAPITGPSSVCAGYFITLTDATTGGVWSSSNTNATMLGSNVTGVFPGSATISYTVINACGPVAAMHTVTVNPFPDAGIISGAPAVCVGSTTALTESVTGGIWSSSNTALATVGSASGIVSGAGAGTDMIMYSVTNGCGTAPANYPMIVNPLPVAGTISGPSDVCTGSTIILTDAATGGVWSSSNTNAGVAGGVVTGASAGTDVINYTVTTAMCGSLNALKMITVNATPAAGFITGPVSVCVASTVTLTDAATGGVWSSSNGQAVVVDGIVTGISAGTDTMMYIVTNAGCTATATKTIVVNPLPDAGVISGISSVCVGSSITLTESATGGTWGSSNANATVASGLVVGINTGIDTIIYTVNNVSCTATATKTLSVNPFLTAGIITGPSGVCIGSTMTLTDATTGGIWSSTNSRATIALGVVTGVTSGADTIRYAVTNTCGTAIAAKAVTVSVAPAAPVISTQPASSICTGTLYQNFGAATAAATGITYTWTAVNAVVWAEGTGHQYALVNFNEPGNAVVTLNATLTGSSCASHSSVTVNVGTAIAQSPDVSYFTSHFVCTPSNEDSYQWGYDNVSTLDSTLLAGEINQDYLNTSPDFYNKDYWAMTMLGGCLQKTYYHTPTIVQNVNIVAADITVYPNPANNSINVTISADVKGSIEVDVWNIMGQKMTTAMATDNTAVIDVSSLAAGSYLITCYNDGIKIAAARFVKN